MTYPNHLHYTQEHEWVEVKGGFATVGITDHAQHQLGDIVYVELPSPGTAVESGKVCGTVESVKAVSEIFSPVSGQVAEINDALTEAPETVNQDPHGKGWMIRVQLADASLPDGLLSAEQYEKFASEEAD
jgi:glycine cleavage system H protein